MSRTRIEKSAPRPRRDILRVASWITLFAVGALPLWVDPFGADPFRLPKLALLQTTGLLAVWCLAVALARGEIALHELVRVESRRDQLLLAILAVTVISTLFSSLPAVSWKSFITVFSCLALFVAARASVPLRRVMIAGSLIAGVIASLSILGSTIGWTPWRLLLPAADAQTIDGLRAGTLLGNPNGVGCYLAFWFVAVTAYSTPRRRLKIALALLLFAGVVSAGSAGAVLAAVTGAIAVLMRNATDSRKQRLILIAASIVGIAVVAIFATSQFSRISPGDPAPIEKITSRRWGTWLAAASIAASHPVIGTGPGTFSQHYTDARIAVASRDLGFFNTDYPRTFFSEAHSDYLEVLSETGVTGFTLMILALAALVRDRRTRDGGITLAVLALTMFPLQLAVMLGSIAVWAGASLREESP